MRDYPVNLSRKINSIAVIGNYEPRQCGIASFTKDLVEAILNEDADCRCRAIAMNDKPSGYNYPEEVRFEINQDLPEDYRTAAEFLNINQADIVCVQHEFGIFGGPAGSHLLGLLQELQMPVVTTLHTVLVSPPKKHRSVLMQLAEISDRLVVMSRCAVSILQTVYDIPKEKIVYIPHGIPDMPFVDPNYYKDHFDLLGKDIMLTFGLLSRNKGIEYVIKGLPKVIERFPNLVYIVLGATHPHVLKHEGERYRRSLQQMVHELGLEQHVLFKNQFVPFKKLCDYLAASDLYITPYVNEDQITSGTMAYAMGTGKAVISTPYWYAEEMLSEGRGRLVPFRDQEAIADVIIDLLADDAARHQMRKLAYDFNRNATWREVARRYLNTFAEVKRQHNLIPIAQPASILEKQQVINGLEVPEIKLNHLLKLTDDTGLLQHATYSVANRNHGYCTDDNARALIVGIRAKSLSDIDTAELDDLISRYLSFLAYAYNPKYGRFRNFMDYSRQWLEPIGSEDSHGRALWALGTLVAAGRESLHLPMGSRLFMKALQAAVKFHSPRAIAFSLLGIHAYRDTYPGDSKARRSALVLTERLFEKFTANVREDWPWPEDILAYDNAKLPHALLQSGNLIQREDMVQQGLRSLDWLLNIQVENGHLTPIGNNDWYVRGRKRSRFDQQPLEAHSLMEACTAAYEITGENRWLESAVICFKWFTGLNDLGMPLYDADSGGCHDALESNGVNRNEGAESTLAWLLSLIGMHQLDEKEQIYRDKRVNTYWAG